jgi:uncharacterized protein (TIGR03382 family)
MKFALGMLLGFMVAGSASADSTWVYTGNSVSAPSMGQNPLPPNICGCALDGTVTFANPLVSGQPDPVLSYSFTDGAFTFNNTNSTIGIDPFTLNSQPFATWFLNIQTLDGHTAFFSDRYDNFEATDTGIGGLYVQGNHGTWTLETVGATEPATGLFVGLGLAVVALMRRRRKKSLNNTVWEKLG